MNEEEMAVLSAASVVRMRVRYLRTSVRSEDWPRCVDAWDDELDEWLHVAKAIAKERER